MLKLIGMGAIRNMGAVRYCVSSLWENGHNFVSSRSMMVLCAAALYAASCLKLNASIMSRLKGATLVSHCEYSVMRQYQSLSWKQRLH